ncbi:MAG: RusA family crossover junction endodeoxyribonuclease [Sarcina sp.]
MLDYAKEIRIPQKWQTPEFKHFGYDKCVEIVLYGDPISDSRPRVTGFGAVAVINLQKLKQQFKPLYQRSELLQNLMIHSHYHISAKLYMKTTQKDLAFIKKDQSIMKRYKKDMLFDMNIKDVDNMLKVHNDLLFCSDYRITLDDGYNVGFINPEKYTSANPRIVMHILYSSKPDKWSRYKYEDLTPYFEHKICYKYMKMCGRTPRDQVRYLTKYMDNRFKVVTKDPDRIKLIKKLAEVLEEYPSDVLKEMGELEVSRKYNKYDAAVKVLLLILKKYKDIANTITGLKRG